MSVVVVGTLGYDTVETGIERVESVVGGSASFFAIAARFFSPVSVVTALGSDFRAEHQRIFAERGIDMRAVVTRDGPSFRWHGRYHDDFARRETVSLSFNAFANFRPDLLPDLRRADYVFLANVSPDLQNHVLDQIGSPRMIGADTMDHWISDSRAELIETLKRIDLIVINESEARMLSGEHHLIKAGRALMRLGPKIVIIKRGEHGVIQMTADAMYIAPGFPVEAVVDPTGAGDAFAGAVMGYLARVGRIDEPALRSAAVYGNIMGSFTVERFSLDRIADLSWEEIDGRYREFIEMTDTHQALWTSR